MAISLGCSAHEGYYNIILHSDLKTEGFLSEDLFQIKANGNAPIMESSLLKRRARSIESAYENSIERAIDFFIKIRIEKLQEKYPDRLVEIQERYATEIRNKLRFYALNGDIIQKIFNSDGSCAILYRIHYQKLKSVVEKIKVPFYFKGHNPPPSPLEKGGKEGENSNALTPGIKL